jgi:hypothetical protein
VFLQIVILIFYVSLILLLACAWVLEFDLGLV